MRIIPVHNDPTSGILVEHVDHGDKVVQMTYKLSEAWIDQGESCVDETDPHASLVGRDIIYPENSHDRY